MKKRFFYFVCIIFVACLKENWILLFGIGQQNGLYILFCFTFIVVGCRFHFEFSKSVFSKCFILFICFVIKKWLFFISAYFTNSYNSGSIHLSLQNNLFMQYIFFLLWDSSWFIYAFDLIGRISSFVTNLFSASNRISRIVE